MNTLKETKELTLEEQTKIIREVMVKEYTTTCNTCDFEFIGVYTKNGIDLCPKCDADIIEEYKARIKGE